ncbi:phenylalanine--tRNA ligase subunit alpha, partial [Candidatus Pacearchaeota archaeon]
MDKRNEAEIELHPHELKILNVLKEERETPEEIAKKINVDKNEVMRASSWLFSKGLVKIDEKIYEEISLGEEGKIYVKKGLPERQILEFIEKEGKKKGMIRIEELEKKLGKKITSLGIGWLKKKNLARIDKGVIKIKEGRKEKTNDEKLLDLLEKKKRIK